MTIKTSIHLFVLSDRKLIAQKWQDLEKRADVSVFLSWSWISCWLDLVTEKIYWIESRKGSKTIGLGFFVETERKLFGLIPIKQWWLHRTGCPQQDQIWIEYNDILIDKSYEREVRENVFYELENSNVTRTVKEFLFGLSLPNVVEPRPNTLFEQYVVMKTKGYKVNFKNIQNEYLLDIPSKNTRKQITRSKKLLDEESSLNFHVHADKNIVKEMMGDIAELHIKRWHDTAEGSGFTNKSFVDFHKNLIEMNDGSQVEIAVLSQGDVNLGYLMNIIYKDSVYFYLSALKRVTDNRVKIGLTIHTMAIQYYKRKGYNYYDFLGGEARYKQSLAPQYYELLMTKVFRKGLVLKFELYLKNIKKRYLGKN